jgi:hypothetical protein
MTVTALIFTKFVLIRQLFIQNSYIVCHKNPTKTSVADTRSKSDWRTDGWAGGQPDGPAQPPNKTLFLIPTKHLIMHINFSLQSASN